MSKGTLNQVTLIGNLGRDPEVRVTPNGMSVASLALATVESRKNASGQYEDETEWNRVTVFGKTAEFIGNYAKKGSKLSIVGRLRTRKWQDKEGKDQYTTEILANDAQILDRRDPNQAQSRPGQAAPQQSSSGPSPSEPVYDFDDSIPF